MTALRELFEANSYRIKVDKYPFTDDYETTLGIHEGLMAVKSWLLQHLQESPCKKCLSNDSCQRPQEHALEIGFYGCIATDDIKKHNQAIKELLEELKDISLPVHFQSSKEEKQK